MPFYASERTRIKADGHRKLRVYQQWQGNERFFCWGHCMAGPNWRSCIGSVLLLVVPTLVFLIWVAFYMGQRVNWVIFVASCVMPLLCVSWLLMTACRDPGVLPRQEPDEEWLGGRKPRTKEVAVNGHAVQVRYNDTCHFYQPPRAHHCSVNDNCIERFDHHCPWVGTTIGQRNYRTFLLFIYGTTAYIMWTFGISLWSFWVKAADLRAAGKSVDILSVIAANPAGVALCVLCFIFFWFVGGLSGFHTFLVATNQTTYENFSNQRRHNSGSATNPYDLGVFRNCASVWCVRVPPPKIDYRAFVGEARKVQASQRSLEASSAAAAAAPAYYGNPSEDSEPRSPGARPPARASSSGTVGGMPSGGGGGGGGGYGGGVPIGQPAAAAGQVAPLGLSDAGADEAGSATAAAVAPEAVTIDMVPPMGAPQPSAVGPLTAGAAEQQRRRQQQQQQQQQQQARREPQ